MSGADDTPERGWVSDSVAAEHPELALLSIEVAVAPGRSSDATRERLRLLSNRFRGAQAIAMRQDPIPAAYRIFYRHIGLDPDETRTPLEEAAVRRLLEGAFRSQNIVDDALLLGLLDTGVAIWALDAPLLRGRLGIRTSDAGERLGRGDDAAPLPLGRLVVADEQGPVAVLFGETAPGLGVTEATRTARLFALQVAGVPAIHVEEALWTAASVLEPEPPKTSG